MPKITFIEHGGKIHTVEVQSGISVMQAAVDNMVPGIVADCGGTCSCATCHGYIDPDWFSLTGGMGESESGMLDGNAYQQATSRLTCQVKVTDALDGLVVRLPVSQY